ncbi:MAG: thiamine phosphate synthase [Dehalococcoidia bacterium]
MSSNNQISGIYVIVDPEHTLGRDIIFVVKQVLDAGANIIQLRDKISTIDEISRFAYEIQKIVTSYNKTFILNDYVNIAKNINSDGIHVGQKDMSIIKARKILSAEQIIGTSNATTMKKLKSPTIMT